MEDPISFDDEVIADSEDENAGMDYRPRADMEASTIYSKPSVSAFFPVSHQQETNVTSPISAFTAGPSAFPDYPSTFTSAATTRYEKGKGKEAETSITSYTDAHNELDGIPGSIADRAKTRQRPQKTTSSVPEVIELTSDDDDELNIISKPKTKPKPKPKVKPNAREKETKKQAKPAGKTSAPDQTDTPVPPRPRPRPRPVVKPRQAVIDDGASHAPLPTSTPPPSHGPELPIATSPSRFSNNGHDMSSQLPPSDPSLSSFSAAYDGAYNHIPRIETLSTRGKANTDKLPSSPSSLFSDFRGGATKRKKVLLDTDAEVDELATSQSVPDPFQSAGISPSKLSPPPTFFAGSSSSSVGWERENAIVAPAPFPLDSRSQHDIDAETTTFTNVAGTSGMKAGMPPKPKKPRKELSDEYEDGVGSKMIILDEDDQDEDFDPKGDETKKKKGKAAKPSKGKKTKTASERPSKLQVEVFITKKPPTTGQGKAKDKGKKKENAASEQSKETFKSREFIEDSDDEMNAIPPVQASEPSTVTASKSTRPSTTRSITPILTEISGPSPGVPTTKIAYDPVSNDQLSPLSDLDSDSGMPETVASTAKRGSGSGKKKRKSIVELDPEDEGENDDVIVVNNASSSKKRKLDSDKGKKAKKIILSDAEDEDEARPPKQTANAKKNSKKVVHDKDQAQDVQPDVQEQQPSPEASLSSVKENVLPVSSRPTYSTPKPNIMPRLTSTTGGDIKPPLYARYEIAPRRSSLPMSELIRRANSIPGSPFSTPHPSTPSAPGSGPSKLKPLTSRTATAYSPYLKSSRSMLSRIAPLHPNRRTPPPPPPPPPPRKKTKKELELEEKWEEEMVESVGGMEAWAVLGDDERREMRKAKWARELGGWDE